MFQDEAYHVGYNRGVGITPTPYLYIRDDYTLCLRTKLTPRSIYLLVNEQSYIDFHGMNWNLQREELEKISIEFAKLGTHAHPSIMILHP